MWDFIASLHASDVFCAFSKCYNKFTGKLDNFKCYGELEFRRSDDDDDNEFSIRKYKQPTTNAKCNIYARTHSEKERDKVINISSNAYYILCVYWYVFEYTSSLSESANTRAVRLLTCMRTCANEWMELVSIEKLPTQVGIVNGINLHELYSPQKCLVFRPVR